MEDLLTWTRLAIRVRRFREMQSLAKRLNCDFYDGVSGQVNFAHRVEEVVLDITLDVEDWHVIAASLEDGSEKLDVEICTDLLRVFQAWDLTAVEAKLAAIIKKRCYSWDIEKCVTNALPRYGG
jgi:hypothetical protein